MSNSLRIGSGFVVAALLLVSFSFFSVHKAHAQVASVEANPAVVAGEVSSFFQKVWDLGTKVGLDKAAWTISKKAIQSMTKSTVKWIRTGRGGASMYVTDLQNDMLQLGDAVAGNFIRDVAGTDFFCSPFRLDLAGVLDVNYFKYTSKAGFLEANKCTLSGIWGNATDFYNGFVKQGDFSKGGWQGWFELAAKPQGNIYGSYVSASGELGARLTNAEGDQIQLLDWANGFFSWCGDAPAPAGSNPVAKLNNDTCKDEDGKPRAIRTPGTVIEDQLAQQLGSGVRQLELADSFNEIIFATATELAQGLTRKGGDGLGGTVSRYVRETTTFLADFAQGGGNGADGTDENGRAYSPGTRTIKSLVNNILEQIDTITDARDKTVGLFNAAQKAQKDLEYVAAVGSRGGYTTQKACPVIANTAIKWEIRPILLYVERVQNKSNVALDELELMAARNRALEATLLAIEQKRFDLEEEKATLQAGTLTDTQIDRLLVLEEELREVNEDLAERATEAEARVVAFDNLLVNEEKMLLASEIGTIIQNTTPGSDPPTTMIAKVKWYSAKSDDKHQCSNIYNHGGGLRDALDALLLSSKRKLETAIAQRDYAAERGDTAAAAQYSLDVTRLTASTTVIANESRAAANSSYGGGVTGPEVQEWFIAQRTSETARQVGAEWQRQLELYESQVAQSEMTEDEQVDAGVRLGVASDKINQLIDAGNFVSARENINLIKTNLEAVADRLDAKDKAGARSGLQNAFNSLVIEFVTLQVNDSRTPGAVPYDGTFKVTWATVTAESCSVKGDPIYATPTGSTHWDSSFAIETAGTQQLTAHHATKGYVANLNVSIECSIRGQASPVSASISVPVARPPQ